MGGLLGAVALTILAGFAVLSIWLKRRQQPHRKSLGDNLNLPSSISMALPDPPPYSELPGSLEVVVRARTVHIIPTIPNGKSRLIVSDRKI